MYLKKIKQALFVIGLIGLIGVTCKVQADVRAETLAVIVNISDKTSVEVGKYYKKKRNIPDQNVIEVEFESGKNSLSVDEFERIYAKVKRLTPEGIQAYVLTWSLPYKVNCMSITSAFALGFDKVYCADGCKMTQRVPYSNSNSMEPFKDYGIRPTMMLAAKDVKSVRALIDRGVAADYTRPKASTYLLNTSDSQRSVRSVIHPLVKQTLEKVADINILDEDYIKDESGIMFYFTGTASVKNLNTLDFAPGAIADHLTSAGGVLFDSYQMSILEWIGAGATASYGAVVEPCNYLEKFPNPGIVMQQYLSGDTLIEAYWKSVAMPGQGVFVGEPLSAPYRGCKLSLNKSGKFEFIQNQAANYVMRSSTACH